MENYLQSESQTRSTSIDTQLAQAGWSNSRRSFIEEYALQTLHHDAPYGREQFADYVLFGADLNPLAVVEAKRSSRDELAGKRQAADYADIIQRKYGYDPFIFLTNGKEIQFWDRINYSPRNVSGFYTRDDLERLLHQRKFAEPLNEVVINAGIAGRDYQNEAIRRVMEGIQQAKRNFLLVMATGTGITRTTIALIDLLLRAKRVQRVLFLAHRRELVRQAMSEFKAHLPNESLAKIESGETSGARIQFATYPRMMQVYERLSVGYYDLIVADESHRSIYQRFKAIFDHFDAIMREFMDHCRKDIRGLPHKTIIFAMSHAHAKRLYESFNRLYPEWHRQGLAEIIDSHMERAEATLDDFKYKTMPRVAISVDMLDTGIDIPSIQNLVFAKPVFSQVKFWQMIVRGTRLWFDPTTGEIKKDFLIIDHWKNFAYFKLNPEGEINQSSEPLPVGLFRLRLEKWQLHHAQSHNTGEVIAELQNMLAGLPRLRNVHEIT